MLAEQHNEWAVTRRYMAAEGLAKARLHVIDGAVDESDEVNETTTEQVM